MQIKTQLPTDKYKLGREENDAQLVSFPSKSTALALAGICPFFISDIGAT